MRFPKPISSTINMQQSVHISQREKSVVLLSSIKMTGKVEAAQSSNSEIIKYYNKTKGGLDTMDKMLGYLIISSQCKNNSILYLGNE
ncbi:unnamed protein product [Clavelina lepadiformis]|uniref:Uncharacterized protein n=1 Tax=Clavelina lepadiformis TaxID=159417 RepID=A0ABP0GGZ0_CLALP